MNGYEKLCLQTAASLGRKLEEKELEFLSWLYNRSKEEMMTREQMKMKATTVILKP